MRFSIVSLLLFATVVGLAIAYWKLSRDNENLQRENRVLRDKEIQQLPPGQVVVRRLASNSPNSWRYRVHIPENTGNWTFCFGGNDGIGQMRHPTGTFTVTIVLTEKPKRDGGAAWYLNYGTSEFSRSEDREISPDTARRLREQFLWNVSPSETNMAPPPFIGFLKSDDFSVWMQQGAYSGAPLSSPIPRDDRLWFDMK